MTDCKHDNITLDDLQVDTANWEVSTVCVCDERFYIEDLIELGYKLVKG